MGRGRGRGKYVKRRGGIGDGERNEGRKRNATYLKALKKAKKEKNSKRPLEIEVKEKRLSN